MQILDGFQKKTADEYTLFAIMCLKDFLILNSCWQKSLVTTKVDI